jgi:glycosyltransferase involved in cell wall biosynthesis
MMQKLNILQIANKPPYPPLDGGAIGMHNVTQGLLDLGHQVKLISINTHKHFVDINTLPEDYKTHTKVEYCFLDTRLKPIDAFLNLFSKKSYHIQRFYQKPYLKLIEESLEKGNFDIVIVESIFLKDYLPHIRKKTKAKIVLRAPNVEYLIWQRLAQEENNPLKKWYLDLLAKRLEREELEAVKSFDAFFTVTEKDRKHLEQVAKSLKSAYIPTGLDVTKEKNIPSTISIKNNPSVFHLGALDWMPNQEGLEWFLRDVWPQVVAKNPKVSMHIAGRRPTKDIFQWQSKHVNVLGEIDDAAEFLEKHDIMIVPLFSGSGMRVKIIEGMMMGKAIISTSIGAEGLKVEHMKDILIADQAEDFVYHLNYLLDHPDELQRLGKAAQASAVQNYSNRNLAIKLEEFLLSI